MPNPFHHDMHGDRGKSGKPPAPRKPKAGASMPMRTANWQGLPGKTQPGTRDKSGTKKVQEHPRSEGI